MQHMHIAALISDFLEAKGITSESSTATQVVGTKPTFNLQRTSDTSWTVLNNSLGKSDRMYFNGGPECYGPMEALRRLGNGEQARGYRLFSHLLLEHMTDIDAAAEEVINEGDFSTVYHIDPANKTILVSFNGQAVTSLVF